MSLLILHRNPFEPFPYERWLTGYDGEVVVLAARDKFASFAEPVPDGPGPYFTHLELLDDFLDGRRVRARALELARRFGTKLVVALHEGDLLHAAWLREKLGLPGHRTADLAPFRDKLLMKRLAAAAGVPVARHAAPRTAGEALAFADEHGFPVVVKDRAGFNSIGLRILHDRDQLTGQVAGAYADGPRDDLLIEAYVPGRMCHVDGLVVGGETVLAWPSQYQYDLASFGTDHGARVDVTLDPADPLTPRLLELTDRTLAALRPPGSAMLDHAFHAEIFHTADDRLVLCEVAGRTAGAKVREVIVAMFGVNLAECVLRLEVGLPLPPLPSPPPGGGLPRPAAMSGQVLLMKRPGEVRSVPRQPAEPWVSNFWVWAEPGQVIPPAAGSADFLAAAVATAPTRAECEGRLRELGRRFEAQTTMASPR
ncbi:ATP-binding protein [Mangrovihabitans endophyticus]|uniref:ATP-grasp domain-containing protein n=1 Tax=Mangrovihabitans endophyticus TaxID=1751298 RepID=A0A8J3BWW6_9ACTN|nr:hypothetical protein [Mangrovihabitans endophyticus]GGK73927.1 hypothetical protein GCM10012284_04860 [Mangrovihabitans endophyticus]